MDNINMGKVGSLRSGVQKSEMGLTGLKSRCLKGPIRSEGPKEANSLPFPVSGGHVHVLSCGSIFHLQSQRCSIFKSLTLTSASVAT